MDRRNPAQEIHPPVSGFACPECAGTRVRLATVAEAFFYLRCDACAHLWSHPERRQMQRRLSLPNTPEPLKAELRPSLTDRRKA
jgi:hypothetical protein